MMFRQRALPPDATQLPALGAVKVNIGKLPPGGVGDVSCPKPLKVKVGGLLNVALTVVTTTLLPPSDVGLFSI